MEQNYLQLATAYESLAAAYRSMAKAGKTDKVAPAEAAAPEIPAAPAEAPAVTIEDVRAVLSAKMEAGKRKEVKALLMKYDSGKLSGVKPEDYAALKAEAEAL